MNILRLSVKDNEKLAALFAGRKPGEKVKLSIEGVINRNDPEEITAAIRSVDSEDIFPGDEEDDEDDDGAIESMDDEDTGIGAALSKKNQGSATRPTSGY